jgi:hypothetical protein
VRFWLPFPCDKPVAAGEDGGLFGGFSGSFCEPFRKTVCPLSRFLPHRGVILFGIVWHGGQPFGSVLLMKINLRVKNRMVGAAKNGSYSSAIV